MRIISWNCNSVRIRLHLIKKIYDNLRPDILCLQETKVENSSFPLEDLQAIGFKYCYFEGIKSYNGVAILSKFPLELIGPSIVDGEHDFRSHIQNQARSLSAAMVGATLGNGEKKDVIIHNLYIPAGGDIADITINPKFDHKMQFAHGVKNHFTKEHKSESGNIHILLGDLNIAPHENDVWSHKSLLEVVSHTKIETDLLDACKLDSNFFDCHRDPAGDKKKIYSWWSYRAMDPMASNRGRRLDHIWINHYNGSSADSHSLLLESGISAYFRTMPKPSDHVPIFSDFNIKIPI